MVHSLGGQRGGGEQKRREIEVVEVLKDRQKWEEGDREMDRREGKERDRWYEKWGAGEGKKEGREERDKSIKPTPGGC